jgi:hypothetical protein
MTNNENYLRLSKARDEVYQAKLSLEAAVRKVIICIGCIDLYPDGEDKDIAKEDTKKAKTILYHMLDKYEKALSDYNNILAKSGLKQMHNFSSSHEIIEIFYEKFYNK